MIEGSALLARAKEGDETSFRALVSPHRRELVAHCYRLTGSMFEAEDLVQEGLLRAWKGLDGYEERASLRSWLYRITTNVCLTELDKRKRRVMPEQLGGPSPLDAPMAPMIHEPVWIEPCPEDVWTSTEPGPDAQLTARESVATAFLAIIQTLPPLQRAVLVLRDVLGWSAAESADALETSVAAVNSALQRARAAIEKWRETGEERVGLDPADARARVLLQRYVDAWQTGDVDRLADLLREDATLTMPPVPTWYAGRDTVLPFFRFIATTMGSFRMRPIVASGLPAVADYIQRPGEQTWQAHAIHTLRADVDGRLVAVEVFIGPQLFEKFGLPVALG